MLLSVVGMLKPPLPGGEHLHFLGRASHAIFLSLIAQKDASLATKLHDEDGPRPYTASIFVNSFITASPFLRLTSGTPEVSQAILATLNTNAPSQLMLDEKEIVVERWCLESGEHPWAGRTTYPELVARWWRPHLPYQVTLQFVSPTTFRSRGQNLPFPLPDLVFGSLLERWNTHATLALEPQLREFFRDGVAVSQMKLQTSMVNLAGGKQVGFLGSCTYIATKQEPYAVAAMNILADFAFYAGVGAKTTMGMGQTRRLDAPSERMVKP